MSPFINNVYKVGIVLHKYTIPYFVRICEVCVCKNTTKK